MSVYSILKSGLRNEGSEKMWTTTKVLSDSIEEFLPEEQKEILYNKVYYGINGGHFDRETADNAIQRFHYVDSETGMKMQAPYWTESEVRPIYEKVRSRIPAYNFYDFEVTLNMMKSDNCNKLHRWFPSGDREELLEKLIDEAVNYLDDEDNPYSTEKVWRYLNG